ncbi:MAG: ABC transporter substrate-binding protein [OCS116 cluster bacterium]|nr:ABC transporter substrate-binding protein [OCS116 cluster bacterium]
MNIKHLMIGAIVASITSTSAAFASDFPQTFEHRYGTTVIEQKPIRVVTLSYNGPDNLLALGVKPLALRYWWGDYPYAVWPWAQQALGDAKPVVIKGDGINIEQIAALAPDVIVGMYSGISEEEYKLLSEIAPVVAAEKQYTDYSTPWHVRARTIGRVVGQAEKANGMVDAINQRIADVAAAHPEWQGKTAVIGSARPSAYSSIDPRPKLIAQFGFKTPKKIDELAGEGKFYVEISKEDISPLEADILVWMTYSDSDIDEVKQLALRKTLATHKNGGEIIADEVLAGAFSWASLLSLNYVIDTLVPLMEQAADGDPATIVTSSQAAGILD